LIKGPFEIYVPEDYQPGRLPLSIAEIRRRFLVNIVASADSDGACKIAPLPETTIQPGHILGVYGPLKAVARFVRDFGVILKEEPECFKDSMFNPSLAGIVEGVVSPRSSLIGKTINEAYRAVDWRTVFLLGGLIPLGMAMDQTGTAEWIARGIVIGLGTLMSPLLLLIVLATSSCGFTMVISNVGACTLLIPLGISISNQIGVDPRVAAIVVGLGVSNSFLLPTHQVNALYMGPGEYKTKDYIKIGGLLAAIYIVILVAMIYFFYL
jgi:hypothetical protein